MSAFQGVLKKMEMERHMSRWERFVFEGSSCPEIYILGFRLSAGTKQAKAFHGLNIAGWTKC